jgi:hypothetical protein
MNWTEQFIFSKEFLYVLYTAPLQMLTLSGHPAEVTDSVSHLPHLDNQAHHHKQSPELRTFLN